MNLDFKQDFLSATKGKIIFGFLMAIFALLAAWGVSKLVFTEMIKTVDAVSAPDRKLTLVNQIFNNVSRLDQKQQYLAINQHDDERFVAETRQVRKSLDTLSALYAADSMQTERIKSVKKLLLERDRQFILYLTVRDSLLSTKSFSKEIEKLNKIFQQRAFQTDSAVYTTESTTAVTTIQEDKNKGFFNKIFGKKKPEEYKVVSEELKIKRDTLDQFAEDSLLHSMENSLDLIKNRQRLKSQKFVDKERNLLSTSNKLTQQMLNILNEVRNEALAQIERKGVTARKVVGDGIRQISIILIAFLALTLMLGYLILTDIAKSNRYRKALEEAKDLADYNARAKQRFLSNMSHEIRTPLQSIIGYSEQLALHQADASKSLEAINLSAKHLLYIINEILDYSRIISGKFIFKTEVFELKSVFDEVLQITKPLADAKNLQLTHNIQISENLFVKADAFRLKQILFNLIGNAIKFTDAGTVSLNLAYTKEKTNYALKISVSDTGQGMDAQQMASIFEEFDNGKNGNRTDLESTGLGLSIVKQLIDLQNGKIEVSSKKGVGSNFAVNLVLPIAEAPKIAAPSDLRDNCCYTEKMVWLVDDDQLILDLYSAILSQHGLSYQIFSNPKAVLEAKIATNLGFVLMDMRMPEIDGTALIKLLKPKVSPRTKFYAVTAQVLSAEQKIILDAGFDGIIHKPFNQNTLLSLFIDDSAEFKNINTQNLKKMTFGDETQLAKILKRFADECRADILLLKSELIQQECKLCQLIVHRLAGRTGQIGYKQLAFAFRKVESQLQTNQHFSEDLTQEINYLLCKLDRFIDYIAERNYSI
ncbi:hypothetical protein BCY91_08390 [Pelobium manganitolerans]|uniref:histidine kinase n=1 Tax=Pelobium manganitolerans TaxID=1842495 RepID=A0A419S488_9SPHI|nr:ATP-binding protein [Pelobium manganitolerans]RKD14479.1 hypothetical protein BCY91_08390 [Pelobium manganitolerans]